ncbi:MAG: MerR family transcriptional regulator [Eubacteriales bacterium]|nr:MerR family transcriptional regulator [Eubacteriales bacterium]
MMTVKELSNRTGISIRSLHYYDQIGLLIPTSRSKTGYRLYDDDALETLQQILFFREFDIPLKEIKEILHASALSRNQILQIQRTMLVRQKERFERLIDRIDEILDGDNHMDFEIFHRSELMEISQSMYEHMPDNIKQAAIAEFGSFER